MLGCGYHIPPSPMPQNEPHDAIRIFTDDVEEVRAYPRQHVLDHLSQHAPDLTITYLVSIYFMRVSL